MQADIHPKYVTEATATCACGRSFTVGSTSEKLSVEICSACHPFYTGNEKLLDAAGRVEKFKARTAKAASKKSK
jgi:large subunit ribosomal protein L31